MKHADRKLLLLGMLRIQAMHGYQLNQFLEEHMDFMPGIKLSTVYYGLERLMEAGLVTSRTEQVGNRPIRQIYEITPAGEAEFQRLLRENLRRYDPGESADDIGIAFLNALPPDQVFLWLADKRKVIEGEIAKLEEAMGRISAGDSTHLSLSRTLRRLRSDLAWLDEVEVWLRQKESTS